MSYTENKNIDGLEELTSLDDTDVLITGDQSDADRAKKITKANFEADLALTASQVSDFDTEVVNNSAVALNTAKNTYPSADATKLAGIEEGAEANNINDTNATDLTDSGDSTLHYHSTDRARENHTGTQTASTISDFDTKVANNSAVVLNTAKETNATHTGEVTGDGALTIADNVIDEANLKVNTPINDQVLTADSGEAGGMKWATPSSGFSDPMTTRGDIIIKDASNNTTRLGIGTNGQALLSNGTDIAWGNLSGGGDMLASTYDPASISEQLVGLTATQTLTNKTIDGDNNSILNVASDNVNLNTMSGVSRTLTDYMNTIQSSGYVSGGDFTDNGDGTAKILAGAGFIKTTNAVGGTSIGITWAENSSLTMVANTTNYIYVDYNAGTPIVKTSTTNPTDTRTTIHLGKIYRNGSNDLHLFKAGSYIPEHTSTNIGRWIAQFGEVALISGGLVAETGNRYLTVGSATLFGGIVKTTTSAVDTSGADTFVQFYTDGAGGWNESDISQVNNTQYDNGGTLTNLSNNRHRTDFVYLDNDGHIYIILGTNNDYFLSDAQAVKPPSSAPSVVSNFTTLIAKIIVKEGETNLIEIDNLEKGATFSSSGITVHNETTGIQGGTSDEYYHLTSAEHTIVGNTSGTNTGDNPGLENVVEDTTPQLGGELDAQAHSIGFTLQTVTYNATTTTADWKNGNKAKMTFGAGNIGTFAFTNPTKPCSVQLILVQDGTGSRTVAAWDSDIKWAGGTAPTLSTGANAIDIVSFIWDGTNYYGTITKNFS